MAPRPIWSGTISFGLVSIPVRMLTATSSRELRFHFVDRRDLEPLGYDKVRKDTGEHVDPDDIVRAFEIEKGRYVPIESEDLDRLDVELTHSVDICDFVSLDEIDPIYFRQAYYLAPQEGGEKPYRLLAQALEETGRVGIAKVVIRNKQHLACLRPYGRVLVLETMYYADEVRPPAEVVDEASETEDLRKAEIEMAKTLVENLSAEFDPERYDDTYRSELLELIRSKAEGEPLPERREEGAEVVDLMQALRDSVERTQKARGSRKAS
ncbi:MAG TPA: Ku protein [Gaiellaceae bacterium]|nr:Ku protein [Gaiellaceae bacterium]